MTKGQSGQTVRTEGLTSKVIHNGPKYRPEDFQPLVNVFFTDSKSGVSVQVSLSREITDYLESLTTEQVNEFLSNSIEVCYNEGKKSNRCGGIRA